MIPERYRDVMLDQLVGGPAKYVDKARRFVREFSAKEAKGIYIHSESRGVGKSHLAVCVMKGLVMEGKVRGQVSFFNFPKLVDVLTESEKHEDHQYQTWRLRLERSSVFVLDDLSCARQVAWKYETAYEVINELYERKRTVIFTSNVALGSLGDYFGPMGWTIISRIRGMCPYQWDVTGTGGPDDDFRRRS